MSAMSCVCLYVYTCEYSTSTGGTKSDPILWQDQFQSHTDIAQIIYGISIYSLNETQMLEKLNINTKIIYFFNI